MPTSDVLSPERRALLKHLSGRVWGSMREILGTTGDVFPPTLWLCNDEAIRFIRCRPFRRGPDASMAMMGMALIPRREGDWAEFLAWERRDVSLATMGKPEPLALQTLRVVLSGETVLATQEFDLPGSPDTVFFHHVRSRTVRSQEELPDALRVAAFGRLPVQNQPTQEDHLQILADERYQFGIEWRGASAWPAERSWFTVALVRQPLNDHPDL